jgi:hypothetical protein
MRNGDRRRSQLAAARSGRVLGILIIAASVAMIFSGRDFFITVLVGFFILSASRSEERAARLLRTLDDRTAGEIMRPITLTAPDWTTVASFGPVAEPALLLGWDGTPNALLPPGAVHAVSPEARQHTQLRALGVRLDLLPHVPLSAHATEVVAAGLPAIVDDSEGRPVGAISVDELNVVAQHDPVSARSAR